MIKFTVPQKELTAALSKMQNIASSNKSLPVLSHVLLEATETALLVTATDLEVGCHTVIPGIIWDKPFFRPVKLVLPGKKTFECVKSIPIGEVSFSTDLAVGRTIITGGTASFTMAGMEPDNYPTLPEVNGPEISFDVTTLHDAIEAVDYAQSNDSEKTNLMSNKTDITDSIQAFAAIYSDGTMRECICQRAPPVDLIRESR